MKKISFVMAVMLVLSACATQPKVDNTPKNPTVVFDAKGTVSGIVMPDFTFDQKVYTRSDRRHITNDREYGSWFVDKMLGGVHTTIFRMDKNLLWEIHDKKYQECPLAGCASDWLMGMQSREEEEDEFTYETDAEACPLTATTNAFEVKETGQTRVLAGYPTKQYHAQWLVEYEDEKGRKDVNTLNIYFWNTEPDENMKRVWEINEQATTAYRNSIDAPKNPLSMFMANELFNALSAFSGDTSKESKKWNTEVTRKLATAKGYPISIRMEWLMDRNACPELAQKPQKQGMNWSNPLSTLKESAKGVVDEAVKGYFAPDPDEPIFHYVYEVKQVGIEPIHDSAFMVPEGYKLITRD